MKKEKEVWRHVTGCHASQVTLSLKRKSPWRHLEKKRGFHAGIFGDFSGHLLSLLLIDPNDTRAEITLLHMPIQTNSAVIEHIFLSMNSKWRTSGIRHAPGEQKRGDRWQLYLECDDRKSIPDEFVLNEMGPEGQDIKVKIFVNGRCVGQIPEKEQTTKLSPLQPPTTPRSPPYPRHFVQTLIPYPKSTYPLTPYI